MFCTYFQIVPFPGDKRHYTALLAIRFFPIIKDVSSTKTRAHALPLSAEILLNRHTEELEKFWDNSAAPWQFVELWFKRWLACDWLYRTTPRAILIWIEAVSDFLMCVFSLYKFLAIAFEFFWTPHHTKYLTTVFWNVQGFTGRNNFLFLLIP